MNVHVKLYSNIFLVNFRLSLILVSCEFAAEHEREFIWNMWCEPSNIAWKV